jgi:hypothetical protein
MEELDVLEAGHEGHPADGRLEGVEGSACGGVPDRVDLGRDPGLGGATGQVTQDLGRRHEDATVVRSGPGLEERRGLRSERAVGEQLEPADRRPVAWARPERGAAAEAPFRGQLEALGAEAGMDVDRQLARLGQRRVDIEAGQRRVQLDRSWIVDGDDAELGQAPSHPRDEPSELGRAGNRDPGRDERSGILEEDALR